MKPGSTTLRALLFFALGSVSAAAAQGQGSPAPGDPGWDELVTLHEELGALRQTPRVEGVPQFGPAAVEARADALARIRRRLGSLEPGAWSVAGKVDYLLVWARANALEFEHRVTRPWSTDPLLYLEQVQRVPYAELPLEGDAAERWRTSLGAVPGTLAQARENLSEANGELADLALFHLSNFDGVGQGQPYRDQPPEGVLGWYRDLCRRIEATQPRDLEACRAALDAVEGYRDWLVSRRPELPASAGIGTENLEWYFRNVRLLPWGVEEIALLGEREFHRFRTAYEIVRNRDRDLPPLALTTSAEEHEARTREAERQILALIRDQNLLTLPDDLPDAFETDVFWSPRAPTDRHFWEEIQFRNALNNHIHASVPGHRFDGLLARSVANPIRRGYGDSSRAEGWATYIEEMFVLAGLTDAVPQADELFYVALMKRASRIYAEAMMHAGAFSLEEANRYMIDYVTYMEPDLGRYDLAGYLRRPGSGSGYIIGKIQLEQLLSERALASGPDFDLGAFHDAVLNQGMIPLTLIRWEMTGAADEVGPLWLEATGEPLGR